MRKEKNLVIIESVKNVGREYVINLTTGVVYGLTGKPIKSVNREIENALHENRDKDYNIFTRNLYQWFRWCSSYREEVLCTLQLAERLNNMGWKGCETIYIETCVYIEENMKAFLKWFKENPNARDLSDFIFFHRTKIFADKYSKYIPTDLSYDMEKIANAIYNHTSFQELSESDKTTYVALFFKYTLEFFDKPDHPNGTGHIFDSFRVLDEMFRYASLLKVKVDKGDFYKQYIALKKCYKVKKAELDKQALIDNQLKHAKALSFSNDMFEVVIPTTEKEFEEEAKAQQNCVYSAYFPRVIKGNTNVVFIRRTNALDKPYITCEVNNGCIYQYLTKCNGNVRDILALEFKDLYQAHLKEWWGK